MEVNGQKPDYRALHEEMAKHKFFRTFNDEGREMFLPPAEYIGTAADVHPQFLARTVQG